VELVNLVASWGMKSEQISQVSMIEESLIQAELSGKPFDAVIFDSIANEDQAISICRKIHNEKGRSFIKMIMLSSVRRRGDAQIFREAGFSAYMAKPVRPSDLFDAMITVFSEESRIRKADTKLVTRHTVRELRKTRMKVLLVEDNVVNQKVALGILKKAGIQADTAENGIQALEALEKNSYQLVLMDLQMPEMDGFEATRKIRNNGRSYCDIVIIAMTANALPGDREACIQAGMNDYIAKPVTPADLMQMLDRWLPKDKSSA